MNKVFLIRHAESESNIGKVFVHQNTIKITQKGKQQAADLLEVLEKPNKIICSKYIRTVETAEPLMEKFPESEIHLWIDSHEFQPLDSKRNDGITTEQRNNNNKLYWLRLDPFYHDGGNSESFKEFVQRVNLCILKMKNLSGVNYIFSHENFIRCSLVLLRYFPESNFENEEVDLYLKIMEKFSETYHSGTLDIKNIEIFNISEELGSFQKML